MDGCEDKVGTGVKDVGPIEGIDDGCLVGEADGRVEGKSEGTSEGTSEGISEGAIVGILIMAEAEKRFINSVSASFLSVSMIGEVSSSF